jgi:hypothetical protein
MERRFAFAPAVGLLLAIFSLISIVNGLDALTSVPTMTTLPSKSIGATALGSAFDPSTGRMYLAGDGFVSEVRTRFKNPIMRYYWQKVLISTVFLLVR